MVGTGGLFGLQYCFVMRAHNYITFADLCMIQLILQLFFMTLMMFGGNPGCSV